jgi:cobalt-zinc-cadmium efflux system outer membrane protein
MCGTKRSLAVALVALTVTACRPHAAKTAPVRVLKTVGERTLGGGSSIDPAAQVPSLPAGPLTLNQTVRLAVARSPIVRVALADVGLAAADLWQASLLPNPQIGASFGAARTPGTPDISGVGVSVDLIRTLQTPLRRRVAAQDLDAAERRVADAIYAFSVDVQRAYVQVQYAQQLLELRQRVAVATAASAGAARELRKAGSVPELLVAGEEALAAAAVAGVADAEGELGHARAELAAFLATSPSDTAWYVAQELPSPAGLALSIAQLDSLARTRRLDLAAAEASARAAASAAGLTSAFRLLESGAIGGFVERGPDGRFSGVSGGLSLPLADQGGARVASTRAELARRVAAHEALRLGIRADVAARLARYTATRRRAEQMRDVELPARRRLVELAQRHVNAMDLSVFSLLQSKQMEIDAGLRYLDALRDHALARADLERAIGGALPASEAP